jgi:hypothetical protein
MIYNSSTLTYASEQTTAAGLLHSDILNVPGKMSWGCDIALMYTMPNQPGYSFEAGWYHIHAKFSHSATSDNIVPAHSVSLTLAAPGTAKVNANMTINFFDLLLKKAFSFGDWVSMTPAVGLVGGYMNGKSNSHFNATSGAFSGGASPTTVANLFYSSKFEGIGVKLGGCSSFKIWGGFKLKAELFYNVLYGFNKASLAYSQNGLFLGLLNATKLHFDQHIGRAFFDSLLGFSWDTTFVNNAYFLDLHAGWRFQSFSDGWNEFEAELNDSVHEISLTGQGLQAGATFRF